MASFVALDEELYSKSDIISKDVLANDLHCCDFMMVQKPLPQPVVATFGRLDPRALGLAMAVLFGLALFLATTILVLQGGPRVGPMLSLLSQYFPGYTVTWAGAVIGFVYAAVCGFLIGFFFAVLRNGVAHVVLYSFRRKIERTSTNDLP